MKHAHLWTMPVLIAGLIFFAGTPASSAQTMMGGNAHHSFMAMMGQMDSLMTEMHGMMMGSSGHTMMGGSNMAKMGPLMMTDSLTQNMYSIGSGMQSAMRSMHQLMGNREFMSDPGHRKALEGMQSRMRGMMMSLQGMIGEMGGLKDE